ncbi:MAG: hypothetical protein ISN28_10360 [Ectothiorhodospiraceae bacterium AqS1]|nr:hypothetical protein [Ectothiorhodospiraceae bacterium AqS1]
MTFWRILCAILAGVLAAPTYFASIVLMFWADGKIWGSGSRRSEDKSFVDAQAAQVEREYAFIRQGLIEFVDVADDQRDEAEEAFIRRVTINAINARKMQRGDARESLLRQGPMDPRALTQAQKDAEYARIERALIDLLGVARSRQDAANEAFIRRALIEAIESRRARKAH